MLLHVKDKIKQQPKEGIMPELKNNSLLQEGFQEDVRNISFGTLLVRELNIGFLELLQVNHVINGDPVKRKNQRNSTGSPLVVNHMLLSYS